MTRDGSRGALASYAHELVPRSLAEAAPGLASLLRYPRSYLRSDVVAGVTVGAVAVPASLAMAELAGMPVVYGLYGTFLPLAVYGLLGTSRQHVIGPDATLAALTAVTVAPLAMVGGRWTRRAMRRSQRRWRWRWVSCSSSRARCGWDSWRTSSASRCCSATSTASR